MNLKYFRQNSITQKLSRFISEFPGLCEFWDQDAFNAVIKGEFQALPFMYNVQSDFYNMKNRPELNMAIHHPIIVHYTGGGNCKPWYYQNKHPLKHLYYNYLKTTRFKYYYPPDLPRSWFVFRKLKFMFFK